MGMLYSILIGLSILFVMMLVRRKRYNVSLKKMLVLHPVVTLLTVFGANLGSLLGGMSFLGLRLYGFLLVDTIALFFLYRFYKMEIGSLGDYLGPAIIAVCCIVKLPCILDGCCYGKELYVDAAGNSVCFPSQIVEFSMWAVLTLWLCILEARGKHKNLLWPITAFWFGILRFLVDFMRGNPAELRLHILGMPAGRFWSLIVAVLGIVCMVVFFKKYRGRTPKVGEVLRNIVGL